MTTHAPYTTGTLDNGEWRQITPGGRFKILVSSDETKGDYLIFEFVADPGNGVALHVHDNEEEHFLVLDGTAHLVNGDTRLDAKPGTAVTVKRGIPHAWCNLSDRPLRMLVIFTPGHIEGLFRALIDRGDQDLEALGLSYGTRFVGPPPHDRVFTFTAPRS